MTSLARLQSVAELEQWRANLVAARSDSKRRLTVCGGTGCRALSSDGVGEALSA